jgi:hypothetical protein
MDVAACTDAIGGICPTDSLAEVTGAASQANDRMKIATAMMIIGDLTSMIPIPLLADANILRTKSAEFDSAFKH